MTDLVALLRCQKAAMRLRVSRHAVERLIESGKIRPIRIGRRTLLTEREPRCSSRRAPDA
jgi:excisionase family DNA binding protein